MNKRAYLLGALLITGLLLIRAQDMRLTITGRVTPRTLALPDLRGSGDAQAYMGLVNDILRDDIAGSGVVKIAPKTMYPPAIPQQPQDLLTSDPQATAGAAGQSQTVLGRRLPDWSGPPVSADYLAFGYAAAQNGVFVLYGWMYDASRGVQVIGNRYVGAVTEEGARKAAHEFAADIIMTFGGRPVNRTHIYFTSDRTGHKEIWAMDPDGRNQHQITRFNSIAQYASVSPDGSKIAITAWRPGPRIFVFSTDPVRDLGFYNQSSPTNATPSFTPDGRQIVYYSAVGKAHRIFLANLDGSNPRPVTTSEFDDAEPKVNPRTGQQIVFSSGRTGPQQVYVCNIDGSDIQKLTDGTGEASNPSWHPEGQSIAFSWTRGYKPGEFNIFIMDLSTRKYDQLTHDAGKNENPSWDPGGTHIAFGSKRGGSHQIWTMLADGSDLRQLTTTGNNSNPAWGQ